MKLGRCISLMTMLAPAGCFPEPPPPYLIEHERALAIEFEVIQAGPDSRPLTEDSAGRIRTQVMPGDTVRMRPLIAGPDGQVLDVDAAWYLCTNRCFAWDDLEPCTSIPLTRDPDPAIKHECALGRGSTVDVQIAGTTVPNFHQQLALWLDEPGWVPSLQFIAGVPGRLSTDECLRRLGRAPQVEEPVWDCLQQTAEVPFGPVWALYDLADQQGIEPPVIPGPEALAQEPALRAEPRFLVSMDGEDHEIWATGRIVVAPDAALSVDVLIDPEDRQDLIVSRPDGNGGHEFEAVEERILGYWMATGELGELSVDEDGMHAEWRTQPSPTPTIVFLLLRENGAWESLWWFEVDTSGS